jgi:hypothetical protein
MSRGIAGIVVKRAEFGPVVPTVHLNGTSGEQLADGLARVWDALQDACRALRDAAPNGRDYYVQPDRNGKTALSLAVDQYRRRLEVLQALLAEVDAEREGIADQL